MCQLPASDTICDLGGVDELANYGEYSGAPSEQQTYDYAKTILSLMTREKHVDGTNTAASELPVWAGNRCLSPPPNNIMFQSLYRKSFDHRWKHRKLHECCSNI